jgi:hypothetical protein
MWKNVGLSRVKGREYAKNIETFNLNRIIIG